MKSAIVTGCAGFLGYHLCRKLLTEGYAVFGIDNLQTGQMKNVQSLADSFENFNFYYGDICIHEDLANLNGYIAEEGFKISEVYNLACPASPPKYQQNPIQTMMINVVGTNNVCGLASGHGAKFFQASTSEIYGDPSVSPQPESYRGNTSTTGPRACYDEGKRAAESLVYDWQRTKDLDVRVVRIFNTYGPNMDPNDGRVVTNFIDQSICDIAHTIYGNGEQTRSLCYVDDLIEGFRVVMNSDYGDPVNLGNPDEVTIYQISKEINDLMGRNTEYVKFLELPQDDPTNRCPDISVAKSLGWTPKVGRIDGLKRTIAYFEGLTA